MLHKQETGIFPEMEKNELNSIEEKISNVSKEVSANFFRVLEIEKFLSDPACTAKKVEDKLFLVSHTAIYQLPRELFLGRLGEFPDYLHNKNFVSLLKSAARARIIEYFRELTEEYKKDTLKHAFLNECISKLSLIDVSR